jgi:hypothetical protein
MSDALDCHAWSGYHGMRTAINDIGVQMPDIAVIHANYRFRAPSDAIVFMRFSGLTGFGACGSLCAIPQLGV